VNIAHYLRRIQHIKDISYVYVSIRIIKLSRANKSMKWNEMNSSIPGGGWEFLSSPPRPERLLGPPSLLSNGYQGLSPWGTSYW